MLIDGDRFVRALIEDILVFCEPYPSNCSVIVMDNAQLHMKLLITAACQESGVTVIYLPPYRLIITLSNLLLIQHCPTY